MRSRAWYDVLGGRKFALAAATLLTAFVLALMGKLTAEYSAIAVTVNMAFASANAWVTGKGAERAKDAPP